MKVMNVMVRLDAVMSASRPDAVLMWPTRIVPIPGTKRLERLKENIAALAVSLSESELAQISEAVPVGAAAGLRYPEAQMKSVYL